MKVIFIGEPEYIQQRNTWRTLKKQECVVGDEQYELSSGKAR